jgi:hypothetical protein
MWFQSWSSFWSSFRANVVMHDRPAQCVLFSDQQSWKSLASACKPKSSQFQRTITLIGYGLYRFRSLVDLNSVAPVALPPLHCQLRCQLR